MECKSRVIREAMDAQRAQGSGPRSDAHVVAVRVMWGRARERLRERGLIPGSDR